MHYHYEPESCDPRATLPSALMTLQRASAKPSRRRVVALLCAMLLMQLAGLWHGIVHAHGPLHGAHSGAATLPDPGGPDSLFEHHDDAADCQVFDQLSHADAPGFARPDAGAEHAALPRLHAPPPANLAAQASGFRARGPPALA
jgi:hypothetical protein